MNTHTAVLERQDQSQVTTEDRAEEAPAQTTCPLCGHDGQHIRDLDSAFIRQRLGSLFAETVPPDLGIPSYQMHRCDNCLLEYADPMLAGTQSFYQWVTRCPGYYPDCRWEYQVVCEQLVRSNGGRILDVGCGDGLFLELARRCGNVTAVGLDSSDKAVQTCEEKGLRAYSTTVERFVAESPAGEPSFDYAVSFHCLEHVENPLKFVSLMLAVVRPGGKVYLSTPYSPMSFEYSWFDALNHPPHHLTRWNVSAFTQLAKQLGVQIRFHMPPAAALWRRVLLAVALSKGSDTRNGALANLLTAAKHPWSAAKEFHRQLGREKIAGRTVANVVLAELSTPDEH